MARFKGFKRVEAADAEIAYKKGQDVLCVEARTKELYLMKKLNPNATVNLFADIFNLFYVPEMEK